MKKRTISSIVVLSFVAAACSGATAESYCVAVEEMQADIRGDLDGRIALSESTDDPLASVLIGMGGALEAMFTLESYFDRIADAAPPEIKSDAELLAELWSENVENQEKALEGDFLGALAGSLVDGFRMDRPMTVVNDYTVANCGHSI